MKASARARRSRRWLGVIALVIALAALALLWEGSPRSLARRTWRLFELKRVERHAPALRHAAAESGVDPNLLAAIMLVESGGATDAVSKVGALGLFQLMEASAGDAARKLGLPPPTREALLSDGELNARLAAVHVAWLIEHEGPDLERVLVAYNAGRTKLMRWIRADGSYAAWRARQQREGDSQVLEYARRVLELRERFAQRGEIAPPAAPATPGAAEPAAAGAPAPAAPADPRGTFARRPSDDEEPP